MMTHIQGTLLETEVVDMHVGEGQILAEVRRE